MTSCLSPYSARSLVRQRIHALRQSTRLSGSVVFLWEMTSRLSPYSAVSLGRQWIHVGFRLCGFWKNFTRFLREGDSDPEVLQRARWYADTLLWTRVALFLFVFGAHVFIAVCDH